MQAGAAKIGPERRVFTHSIAQAFKLTAAHVFEIGSVGARGGSFIKKYRHAEPPPNFKTGLAGEQDALFQFDAGDGHERDYVGRADARMDPLLPGQVDQLGGFSGTANRCLNHCSGLSGDGNDRAIVVRIHRPVKQMHSLDAHRGNNRLDATGIPALREIGDAFDDWNVHGLLHPDQMAIARAMGHRSDL
jgi:hypothetical protein